MRAAKVVQGQIQQHALKAGLTQYKAVVVAVIHLDNCFRPARNRISDSEIWITPGNPSPGDHREGTTTIRILCTDEDRAYAEEMVETTRLELQHCSG